MRFISKYRRHRFAGPLLLLGALLFAGLTYSAAQAVTEQATLSQSDKATLIAEGKEIFARGCSSFSAARFSQLLSKAICRSGPNIFALVWHSVSE